MEDVIERPEPGTGSSEEADEYVNGFDHSCSDSDGISTRHFTPTTSTDGITPLVSNTSFGWSSSSSARLSRASTTGAYEQVAISTPPINGLHSAQRQIRPSPARQPSNTYAPARKPHQYTSTGRQRNGSATRVRRNPNAEYKAQEKAYVQRIRQDAPDNGFFPTSRTPSLDYDTDTEDDESPTTASYTDNDPYDQEMLLYYGNDEMEPSIEELKIPANRERLEWHSMLANVLTGDVVKQEKKRLIGGSEQHGENALKLEIWIGVRAKTCGRSLQAQRRLIEDGRSKIKQAIENITTFEIKGEAEAGKSPFEQVSEVVKTIEKIEGLYPTRTAFEAANPLAASASYKDACAALFSWYNITSLINTQLSILQSWVGNEELDFTKQRPRPESEMRSNLFDDSSFIDRLLKEDGLKTLHTNGKNKKVNFLTGVNTVIQKAKTTLIENADAFMERHLPPYIEELLTLINFPSRLIQEVIRTRLAYAENMKGPAKQGVMMTEQMIMQFQILLTLAVDAKIEYLNIAQPQQGWDLPPCIDDNFDNTVLDALKFYFQMLLWKLKANKNTFKEAEILELEWDILNGLAQHIDGGDVIVAEQFSKLTSDALVRLKKQFGQELKRRPDEGPGPEMDKRYKAVLDSVRVRQRKIFRFSRILAQRFENATEYNLSMDTEHYQDLLDVLAYSGHFLVDASDNPAAEGMYIIGSPTLQDHAKDIATMLGTCYQAADVLEDPSNPYVLVLRPENPLTWEGHRIQDVIIPQVPTDLKPNRLRLVADGPMHRLGEANANFLDVAHSISLNVLVEQRANLQSVKAELVNIRKTAHDLSRTIMDSVEIVRRQTRGMQCQELIQTCFAFATEFGQRSAMYFDQQWRVMHQLKLTHLALDWVSFICDDCIASERKTFRWAVVALEFAMLMTRGQSILSISEKEYATLRAKVAGCMSLLISHFDIMGARSTVAAQAERQRMESVYGKRGVGEPARPRDDEESAQLVRMQRLEELEKLDNQDKANNSAAQSLGRVLEDSNEADRALTQLSASAGNVHFRWQQGQFIGGGTFGTVYTAIDLDSTHLMAVKEIRLQDPRMIPTIVSQIRDEMGVLHVLDHPNVVQYYGIEPHRDKVYIFMEYCSGGSLAAMLELGRIEDEAVVQWFAFQLVEGLAYLHERKVVHRDIKPENILLDHNHVIKYVDFGAAKVIAKQGRTVIAEGPDGQGRKNSMQGTPMYMSPEVIKGDRPRHARLGAEDIWSLGCVISEMYTGSRPWANMDNEWAIMYNIAKGQSPQLPTRDQVSEIGLDFLKRCFEQDPCKRVSAAELLQHEWILSIKTQLDIEPATPQTPASEASSAFSNIPSGSSSTG